MSKKPFLRSSSGLKHFDNIPVNCLGLELGKETRWRLGLHAAELVQVFDEEDIMSCTKTWPIEDGKKAG